MSASARDPSGWRAMRRRSGPLLASIVALVPLVGCSASPAQPAAGLEPIRIGVVTVCEGDLSEDRNFSLAGAELPFIRRGAHLNVADTPTGGVTSVPVGGRDVELVEACERYGDRSTTISALSSLVERSGVAIVVGPSVADDSIAVREYARAHPDVTFIATGSEQSPTLRRTVPNLYRFDVDEYQWIAPLGRYARRTLGWESAATVGEANTPGYQVAGFVAGFCSAGGQIARTDRLFMDQAGSIDPASLVSRIPASVDGLFLAVSGSGMAERVWRQTHAPLSRHLVAGWQLLYPPDRAALGIVGSSSDPFRETRAWRRYNTLLDRTFPDLGDSGYLNQSSYDAVEPVLEALEHVDGDLSDGQRRFADTLAHLRYHAPQGLITLDRRHQAIGPVYLGRVVMRDGRPTMKQIAVFRHVHQTLGGYFSPSSPAPSQTQPACHPVGRSS